MKFKFEINLNTILLAAILIILLILAYDIYRPDGLKEMIEAIYYTK